jgi:hypothetical protein
MTRKVSRRPTRKLFKEYVPEGTESIDVWRERFVAERDVTEYRGAMALVGSWQEWERFKKEWSAFSGIVDTWVAEIEVILRSEAIHSICGKIGDEVVAAKWIAEGKYQQKTAGKPSKAMVTREAKIAAGVADEADQDIQRALEANATQKLRVVT